MTPTTAPAPTHLDLSDITPQVVGALTLMPVLCELPQGAKARLGADLARRVRAAHPQPHTVHLGSVYWMILAQLKHTPLFCVFQEEHLRAVADTIFELLISPRDDQG